ncbi:MAG: Rpn family recombination-promoting nuclease/putative transposase [Blautia sp.]|nr:Rpn family recombination-promoting nuclease/putative transposase [Blautia sp.]
MIKTAKKDKVKPDVILKEFWRDNERFADLVNAVIFGGEQIILPEELTEADTDISSFIKGNEYVETIRKTLDVVKKSANGVEFVIWGLENQMRIHYAMPLRHLVGDALRYLKEFTELMKKNKKQKEWENADEFLSGMKKEDRLHPVVTICVYYGEDPWDGPGCLTDMLKIPEQLRGIVSDYKMNLIQVRESEGYKFHTDDVNTVFEITRDIFKENYGHIQENYSEREISSELGMVIGAITESDKLIQQALDRKGGMQNMCRALEKLVDEGWADGNLKGRREGELKGRREGELIGRREGELKGRREGELKGRREGELIGKIEGTVKTYQEFQATQKDAVLKLKREFGLTEEEAWDYVKKFWQV